MYTVYQHWDPLDVCVVGRAYPPEFYHWIKNVNTRSKFEQLAEQTEEDLNCLIQLLKKFNVKVLRPDIPKEFDDCWIGGVCTPPPVTPRDYFIVIHDKLWIPTVPNHNHAVTAYNKQHTQNWNQFQLQDQVKHNRKLRFYENIFAEVEKSGTKIVRTDCDYISGCWVSRLGQDLFFATQAAHDDENLIMCQVNDLFPDTTNHVVDAQGHGDAVYCPVAPGLVISIADTDYSKKFPGWEVVRLDSNGFSKQAEFRNSLKLNAGRWYIPEFEKNPNIIEIVNHYFDEWVGNVCETFFGVNILCLDSKNIVISDHDDKLENACARHGINVHVIPFRHKYFWDAGIHCLTNDVSRRGLLKKIL